MKNDVIFSILMFLLTHKKATADELSERFCISTRTVYRYVNALTLANVPIMTSSGNNGGIWIDENYKLGANFFSSEEKQIIIDSLKALRGINDIESIDNIISKFCSLSKATQKETYVLSENFAIDTTSWDYVEGAAEKLRNIIRACKEHISLKIEYHNSGGEVLLREIDVYRLVFKEGIWYAQAYCRLKNEFRLFKISRINKYIFGENFIPIEHDFEELNLDFVTEEYTPCCFKIEEDIRTAMEDWLGADKVITKQDGALYVFASIQLDDFNIRKLFAFCDRMEIVYPSILRQKIIDKLERAKKING